MAIHFAKPLLCRLTILRIYINADPVHTESSRRCHFIHTTERVQNLRAGRYPRQFEAAFRNFNWKCCRMIASIFAALHGFVRDEPYIATASHC
jgi:hypothetical protein